MKVPRAFFSRSLAVSINACNEAAKIITESADPNAKIIFGSVIDEDLKDEIRITVIATGFGSLAKKAGSVDMPISSVTPNYFGRQKRVVADEDPKEEEPEKIAKKKIDFSPTEEKEDGDKKKDGDDELDIPAFIRKKMM